MKIVILGLKNKQTGAFKVYDNYSQRAKKKHKNIKLNEKLLLDSVSVFPFAKFSSLAYEDTIFKNYAPTYLMVESDLTEEELSTMSGGSKMSYSFRNRKVTFLSEMETPFEYSLQQLKKYGSKLGTYDLTTWVIHEETRTPKEYESMCEILRISIENYEKTEYTLDLSLDKYVLPYIDYLKDYKKGTFTFGRGGSISITKEDMQNAKLSDEGYLRLLYDVPMKMDVLIHFPRFDLDYYKEHILSDKKLDEHLALHLYPEMIAEFNNINFDMEFLFSRFYNHKMNQTNYIDGYGSLKDFVKDANYQLAVRTYDPYAYYCCPDCDGYELDDEDVAYDYTEDEQVGFLHEIIYYWNGYLTEKSAPLFKEWDKDIIVRYVKEHPETNVFKNVV